MSGVLCAKVEQHAKCNMHLLRGAAFHHALTVFITSVQYSMLTEYCVHIRQSYNLVNNDRVRQALNFAILINLTCIYLFLIWLFIVVCILVVLYLAG